MMPEFIFTFGFSQTNPVTGASVSGCFTRIVARDREAARHQMNNVWGRQWAFQYDTEAKAGVDRYGLVEIESCPYPDRDGCWDAQEERADATFICPVHGRAEDTLDRLGVDVL